MRMLVAQQPALDLARLTRAAVHESAQAAAGDDAVARDEQRNAIGAARSPNRARCRSDLTSDIPIAQRRTARNRAHRLPDALLIIGSWCLALQIEPEIRIAEIRAQLAAHFARERVDRRERRRCGGQILDLGEA